MEGAGGRETEKGGDICVLTADSGCCDTESNTTLSSNYPPIKKNFFKQETQINTDMYRNKFGRTDTQMLIVTYVRICCFSKVFLLYVFSNFP